jgi:hypothetical protein
LVNPNNNQAAYHYPDYVYQLQSIISNFGNAVSFAALGLFVLGVISGKMVGVEMMAVIQISFLSLMTLESLNPCFAAISSLKFVNQMAKFTSMKDLFLPIPPKCLGLFSFFAILRYSSLLFLWLWLRWLSFSRERLSKHKKKF